MSEQTKQQPTASMSLSRPVRDIDFIVPGAWEGAGDELHSNDIFANETHFGKRILSGITSAAIACANTSNRRRWTYPSAVRWEFAGPVLASDELLISEGTTGADESSYQLTSATTKTLASRGTIEWTGCNPPPEKASPGDCQQTKGRTLFDADNEMFEWWIARHLDAPLRPVESGLVYWTIGPSLVSGLFSRMGFVDGPHGSIVNRGFKWRYFRPIEVGDTICAEVHSTRQRPSRSKPNMGVWTGTVDTVSKQTGHLIATAQWVALYDRAGGLSR